MADQNPSLTCPRCFKLIWKREGPAAAIYCAGACPPTIRIIRPLMTTSFGDPFRIIGDDNRREVLDGKPQPDGTCRIDFKDGGYMIVPPGSWEGPIDQYGRKL